MDDKNIPQNPNYNPRDIRTLLSWSAPGRPYVRRSKQFYSTAVLIALLLSVVSFLFSQYILILVIFSVLFLGFAFAFVPPKNFHYAISTQGIRVEDHFYIWEELYDFYFKRRD